MLIRVGEEVDHSLVDKLQNGVINDMTDGDTTSNGVIVEGINGFQNGGLSVSTELPVKDIYEQKDKSKQSGITIIFPYLSICS